MAGNRLYSLFLLSALFTAASCDSQKTPYESPPGYDLNHPVVFRMPGVLHELSGIAFSGAGDDTLYAEEDENGKVYHFKLGDDHVMVTKFGKKGDFEDITLCNGYVVMLRSDGVLFTFPVSETTGPEAAGVKEFDTLLPEGEYEGLTSSDNGKIYVLCKHCREAKTSKRGGGFIFQLDTAGTLVPAGNFELNIREIEKITGTPKIDFHPAALARNARTGEWFILSSVNHMLVIADDSWRVKAVYPLDPAVFPQPEGITFDRRFNLYIASERAQTAAATVLVFSYHGH